MKHSIQALLLAILMGAAPVLAPADAAGAPSTAVSTTVDGEVPAAYVLSPAYPNPFNPTTSFSLKVRERQRVRVEIYNMLGQPVKELFNGVMESGETRMFVFDAGDLPTGIYLYRIQAERFTAARQVTLLR